MRVARLTVVLAVLALCGVASAEIKMPALFGDGMVLQQGMAAPVWGWGNPGETVTVSFAGQKQTAVAGKDGKWMLKLQPLKASADGQEMTVAGSSTVAIKDVLVGEVWIGSGQSNMQMRVSGVRDAKKEIDEANYPKIHIFTVAMTTADKPQEQVPVKSKIAQQGTLGKWEAVEPKTIPDFSAALYFFGRDLHGKLNVPFGLIQCCWGGTRVEAWMDEPTLSALAPDTMTAWQKTVAGYPAQIAKWETQVAAFKASSQSAPAAKAAATGSAPKRAAAAPAKPPAPENNPNAPCALYNAMLNPLIPYAIRGAIWYQGESNANNADQYHTLFSGMIQDWRKLWNQGDFPFLFVQLANFMAKQPEPTDTPWARVREAQLQTLSLPSTGMAVIIDIGMADNIHPVDKQDVGLRLSLAAQKVAYGKDVVYSGPIFDKMQVKDGKATLSFKFAKGLKADGEKVEGFAVAGADQKFHWADARIVGETVEVSSPDVAAPVAVRYGWANNPTCNLYNEANLPASPFRTDDWPMPAPATKPAATK